MALKARLQSWHDAVTSYNEGACQRCLDTLTSIPDPCSRLFFNIACVQLTLDASKTTDAIESLSYAIDRDRFFALAYFQRGVLHLKEGRLKEAERDFQQTRTLLRGNEHINYTPLGLMKTLHMFEVLHNLAVARLRQGHVTDAKELFKRARRVGHEQYTHQALDLIADNRRSEVKVIELPSNQLFTLPKLITDNLDKRAIQIKAKVVSSRDINDVSVGFGGLERVKQLKADPRLMNKGPWSLGDLQQKIQPRKTSRSQSLTGLVGTTVAGSIGLNVRRGSVVSLLGSAGHALGRSMSLSRLFQGSDIEEATTKLDQERTVTVDDTLHEEEPDFKPEVKHVNQRPPPPSYPPPPLPDRVVFYL